MIHIGGFFKENKHKKMTFLVWMYTAKYRMLIRFVPMKRLRKYFGRDGVESPAEVELEQYRYANQVGMHVGRSASHTPWDSKCLVQALTAQTLLKKKGIPSTLYLGVGKEGDQMVAHAWVRCGRMYVTGGDGSPYAVVDKFTAP